MVFDQNKCVGCGDCKAACNEANHLPPGISRLLMERQSKSHRVIGKEPCPICGKLEECDCERKYVRVSCQQCQDAPCVTVCPTGAAHHDPETGIVTMDPDRCVGCKYCIVGVSLQRALHQRERRRSRTTATSASTRGSQRAASPPAWRAASTMRSFSAT